MSGFLAGKIWQSDLDPELKPLAAALADVANDDGTSIYPSVAYMAWLLSRSERTVQTGLKALRAAGVLRVVKEGGQGAGNTTEYRLVEEMLPTRVTWRDQRASEKGAEFAPLPDKGATEDSGNGQEGCNLRQIRVKPTAPNPSLPVRSEVQPSGPPSPCLRFARPAPQGAMVAPSAKERPSVAHGHSANKCSKDPQQEREPVGKGQEWRALGVERRGIGCDLFRAQWRLHFAKHANNGQPLPRVIGVFLEECAHLRVLVPPAFVRAAEDRCGIKITALRGEAKAQIGICAG